MRSSIGENEVYEPPVMYTESWFRVGLSHEIRETLFFEQSALKGVSLRSETYSQDGTDKAGLPFMISQLSYDVELVQPRGSNKHSVAQMNTREKLSIENERNMQDPRTTHGIILKTNSYDDVEESLQIVCPRTEQAAFDDYAREVTEQYNFRKPLAWKQQEHEILSLSFAGILSVDAAREYDFDGLPKRKCATTWKAICSENRAFYEDSFLLNRLAEAFLILDHTYALAFTPKILDKIELGLRSYKVSGSVDVLKTGKYVKLKDRDGWWCCDVSRCG
ncbi:hypothetical protein TGAM01_v208130 [Trichoderma gamsii]|uniref:Insecticide toxin TcdB middle/C-terminal domain-containing protein n=1 Tax=Trichoderma gamsii TaxID=398673 RepID=A0A2P4ZFR0_9HYPO|nr:hypothetical protein TGAM01_v208130 [Trichoderma gamsii]PON23125.1 hypothetical protein TGAM01_v208130 [Trichoderma gamsii]